MNPQFDVLCIGNAIVDVIAKSDDEFLKAEKIIKGAMNLIDAERAEYLYGKIVGGVETSGGSASNTAAGIASFGGRAAYIGKVADDHLGKVFTNDTRNIGVAFDSKPLSAPPPTARSMIFITEDGERSMNTYLGACVELGVDDIDPGVVEAAKITYFEGYMWDKEAAKQAILKAERIAHRAGRKMAMSLSDSFCVDRYRDEFSELIKTGAVDLVFANEGELASLYQLDDFDAAREKIRADCPLAVITRSEKGSIVINGETTIEIAAHPITELIDVTGAGDLYAAGFLFGLSNNMTLEQCGELGSLAAAETIGHIGPRPKASLKELAANRASTLSAVS